ncbi:16R [Xanthomonas phage Xp10]|uniref:16R n=1 Tax=Xanthomonas phage Xp10 TaxID=2907956 RepID=Q7Y5K1_9CAUD|nr:tail length tape measure protein [Xanthomonas phage Xp10]AAP58683.1 16R [Xanthomonas phage Xp10]
MEGFYHRVPTLEELRKEGSPFLTEHFHEPPAEVWPELWPSVKVFIEAASSWRCGPSGPMSLDRLVLFDILRHKQIDGEQRDQVMDHISVMESTALKKLAE